MERINARACWDWKRIAYIVPYNRHDMNYSYDCRVVVTIRPSQIEKKISFHFPIQTVFCSILKLLRYVTLSEAMHKQSTP